jgi:hypothetical protein
MRVLVLTACFGGMDSAKSFPDQAKRRALRARFHYGKIALPARGI